MIETIYIARHGFRVNWVTTNWQNETGLPRDPPLAAFGVAQAQELADHFLAMPIEERPTMIFSSPYTRCIQTAKPIATALDIPIFVEHGLSEWYSPAVPGTGLHPRPGSASSLRAYFPEIDDSWCSVWYPSRKGEDLDEVHARAAGFWQAFIPTVERGGGSRSDSCHKRILLMSHAATVAALVRTLLADRSLSVRVGCCSLTELVRTGDARTSFGGWEAKRLSDGSHLKEGSLRDWGFEDIEIAGGQVIHHSGIPGSENDVDEPVGCQLHLNSNL